MDDDDACSGEYCPGACGLNEGPTHRHKDHYGASEGLVRGDIPQAHPRGIDGQIMSGALHPCTSRSFFFTSDCIFVVIQTPGRAVPQYCEWLSL